MAVSIPAKGSPPNAVSPVQDAAEATEKAKPSAQRRLEGKVSALIGQSVWEASGEFKAFDAFAGLGATPISSYGEAQRKTIQEHIERLSGPQKVALARNVVALNESARKHFDLYLGNLTRELLTLGLDGKRNDELSTHIALSQAYSWQTLEKHEEVLPLAIEARTRALKGKSRALATEAVLLEARTRTLLLPDAADQDKPKLAREFRGLRVAAEKSRLLKPRDLAGLMLNEMKAFLEADEPAEVSATFGALKRQYGAVPGVNNLLKTFSERNKKAGPTAFLQVLISRGVHLSTGQALGAGSLGAAIGAASGARFGRAGAIAGARMGVAVGELGAMATKAYAERGRAFDALANGFCGERTEDTVRHVGTVALTAWGGAGLPGYGPASKTLERVFGKICTLLWGSIPIGLAIGVVAPFDRTTTPGKYLGGDLGKVANRLWVDKRSEGNATLSLPWSSERLADAAGTVWGYGNREAALSELYGHWAAKFGGDIEHFYLSALMANLVPVVGAGLGAMVDLGYDGFIQPAYRIAVSPWVGFDVTMKRIKHDFGQVAIDFKGLYFGASLPNTPTLQSDSASDK